MQVKNRLIVICGFFLCVSSLSSQTFTPNADDKQSFLNPTPRIDLDTATMRVLYRLEILHDTIREDAKKSNNVMMLQIGQNGIDKYMDLYKQKGDSVMNDLVIEKANTNKVISEYLKYARKALKECIYWNYPNGRLTVADHMLGSYLYEEDIPKINWKLEEGTKTILDYPCQKATCHLFGRNYTAWYTMLIPTFKGPWKFSGLPGLILEVQDEQNQISWTCIGIESTKWTDCIRFSKLDYIKTSKSDFLKSFNDYKRNPGVVVQSSGMVSGDLPEHAKKKRYYNPIELSE